MDENMAIRLKTVVQATRASGKGCLVKYLSGKRITRQGSIDAKCYDCNGYGEQTTCNITTCPLYPFSPYRQKSTDHSFIRTKRVKQPVKEASKEAI